MLACVLIVSFLFDWKCDTLKGLFKEEHVCVFLMLAVDGYWQHEGYNVDN